MSALGHEKMKIFLATGKKFGISSIYMLLVQLFHREKKLEKSINLP